MQPTPRALGAVLLVLATTLGAASAAPGGKKKSSPADVAAAKTEYDNGVAAYNQGRFDDAIASFVRAYAFDPAAILLYNIAQSHWKKGDREQALRHYRDYLDAEPHAANREQVLSRIHEIEAGGERPPAAAAEPERALPPLLERRVELIPIPAGPPPRPSPTAGVVESGPPPLYRRTWFWALAGVVAAGVVATAVLVASSRSSMASPCSSSPGPCNWPPVSAGP
jgi:tetratricopeptide (TPR) repeat protein